MKLQKLKKEHLETIRNIRNNNRQWFFNKLFITQKQQKKWFNEVKKNKKIKFYVIIVKNNIAGAVSMTKTKEGIEIGNVVLDEKYKGQGVMTEAIKKLIKNNKKIFYARILLDNNRSQLLFERCGFKKTAYIMEYEC